MNERKRKLPKVDPLDAKKSKASSQNLGDKAWQQELIMVINEECDVRIDWDVSGLIHKYSMGRWENCMDCNELTDPDHSEWRYTIYGIGWRCWMCDDEKCGRKENEYEYKFD